MRRLLARDINRSPRLSARRTSPHRRRRFAVILRATPRAVAGPFPRCSRSARTQRRLTSHLDVTPTLIEWISGEDDSTSLNVDGLSAVPLAMRTAAAWRRIACRIQAMEATRYAQRTGACALAKPAQPESDAAELYVRPDDRWEANDVAKLCPDVVEELQTVAVDMHRQLALNEPLPPAF